MNKTIKSLIFSLYIMFFLISCDNSKNKTVDSLKHSRSINNSLKETRIGKSNYFISIPPDYSITESNGIDFSVYYFLPKKSEIKNKARGGIYFGNSPSLFEKKNDSCKTEILKGEILGEISDWTVYNCNEDYSIQTIANTKSHAGWDQKVHVFGHVKNKAGIDTILEIYSTLKKK